MAIVSTSTLYNFNTGILKKDACIVIVKTEWNNEIISALELGALQILKQFGFEHVLTLEVPGAVEIPFAIKNFARTSPVKADAFIALGCVIKGDTPHFDYVCQSVTAGITQLNIELPSPVIYGILTVNNEYQAWERLGGIHGHKGEEAAITALKMIHLEVQKKTF